MKRVVVTGLGLVSPLAANVKDSWQRLIACENAAKPITAFDVSDIPSKIACSVPLGDGTNGSFNPDLFLAPSEQRKVDPYITYALVAAQEALEDANWQPMSEEEQQYSGVIIGSGVGGIGGIVETGYVLRDKGARRVSPFFITGRLVNLAAGQVAIKHKLKGPNHSVATACATGAHAIGDAARMIALGDAKIMVAGGTESPINKVSLAGFAACRALSTAYNDQPHKASRPYDKDRDGFVMGEGAAILVVEELEHALARGAKIYAEIIGYGLSGDAYHITSPSPEGEGALRCMQMAVRKADIKISEVDYINAHGTSTMADTIELKAVENLLGADADGKLMSSTKSSTGHMLGAAGAAEAIFSILAMQDNIAPATLNLDNPEIDTKLNLVPRKPIEKEINVIISNSFGFGGTNASLIMRKYKR